MRLTDPRDPRHQPRAWLSAPYIDMRGILNDADLLMEARAYAASMAFNLAKRDLRGIVLGSGAHHPAAVDLLLWEARHDHDMQARLRRAGWPLDTWPTPVWCSDAAGGPEEEAPR